MFAIIPEALDYSETKKTLGLDYPKQTNKSLRKYANCSKQRKS